MQRKLRGAQRIAPIRQKLKNRLNPKILTFEDEEYVDIEEWGEYLGVDLGVIWEEAMEAGFPSLAREIEGICIERELGLSYEMRLHYRKSDKDAFKDDRLRAIYTGIPSCRHRGLSYRDNFYTPRNPPEGVNSRRQAQDKKRWKKVFKEADKARIHEVLYKE